MHFTQTIVAALLAATSAVAAPTAMSMAAAGPEWSFLDVKRFCTTTGCDWTFKIDNHQSGTTAVNFHTRNEHENGGPLTVGDYTITSGWSGQFGPGNGFTTFSVVNNARRLIAYPAYTDKEVQGGNTVSPNRSYPVQNIPK